MVKERRGRRKNGKDGLHGREGERKKSTEPGRKMNRGRRIIIRFQDVQALFYTYVKGGRREQVEGGEKERKEKRGGVIVDGRSGEQL